MTDDIKCPICGSTTTLRTAKKGPDAGKQFYVCENFPECKGRVAYRRAEIVERIGEDSLTKFTRTIVKGATASLVILTPIEIVTTSIGGILIAITFGLFALLLSAIWQPFLWLLLGTSWLWFHAPYLAPLLFLPGLIIAILANIYVMLMPEPDKNAKIAKLALADEWPMSWYVFKPSDK